MWPVMIRWKNLALRHQRAVWKARQPLAAEGTARDRGRLASAEVQALLGVEESTPTRSARDQDGAPRSDSADQPRQSSPGCAEAVLENRAGL